MKVISIVGSLLPLALLFPVLCVAQGSAQTGEIAKLREQIAAQQKQLDEQRQALETARKALDAAQAAIDSQQKMLDRLAAGQGAPAAVPDRKSTRLPVLPAAADANFDAKGRAFSPLAFHIGGADFAPGGFIDRKSTRLNSSHLGISY